MQIEADRISHVEKFELCPKNTEKIIEGCDKWRLYYYISVSESHFHCHWEDGLKEQRPVKRLLQCFRQKLVIDTNIVQWGEQVLDKFVRHLE